MNKVILMGRLTRDPEVRYTQTNNTLVATFSIAVNWLYFLVMFFTTIKFSDELFETFVLFNIIPSSICMFSFEK